MIRGNKFITALFYIALVLVIAGIAGFVLKLTNGGTDTFKFFYLTNEKGDVYGSTDKVRLACNKETKFSVQYTFSDSKGYSVQVLPNITDETEFDYTVDGEAYKFSDIKDVTDAFKVKQYDDYFTVQMPEDMSQVMKVLYAEKEVELPEGIDLMNKPYFKLVAKSYNEKDEVKIMLTRAIIHVDGLEIDPEDVSF